MRQSNHAFDPAIEWSDPRVRQEAAFGDPETRFKVCAECGMAVDRSEQPGLDASRLARELGTEG